MKFLAKLVNSKLSLVLFRPIAEELLFRWVPLIYAGLPALIFFSAVWVLVHDFEKTDFWKLVTGAIVLTGLWIIGFGWLAIVLHCFWNLGVTRPELLKFSHRNRVRMSNRGEEREKQ